MVLVISMNHKIKQLTRKLYMTHLKPYLRQSQVKSNKTPKVRYKPKLPIGALVKKQKANEFIAESKRVIARANEATAMTYFYTSMVYNKRGLIHKLVSLLIDFDTVIPSQTWLACELGCSLRTVNGLLGELDSKGIINKTQRGWKNVDIKNNIYEKRTCAYGYGDKFKEDMVFISKNDNGSRKNMQKIFKSIPALHRYFQTFCVLSLLFLNNSYSKNNHYKKGGVYVPTKYVNSYEIAKIYEEEAISHSKYVFDHTSIASVLPPEHPSDIVYYEDRTPLGEYVDFIGRRPRMTQKREEIELRFCTEYKFKYLSELDKPIASRYFTGRKYYGTVLAYEEYLISTSKEYLVWVPPKSAFQLTKMEIGIIKLFSADDIQFVKNKLKSFPECKNSFKWIFDILKFRSNMEAAEIKKLLKENGFYHRHIFSEEIDADKYRDKYPYKTREPQEAPICSKDMSTSDLAVGEKFKALIGDKAYMDYCSRAGLFDSSD